MVMFSQKNSQKSLKWQKIGKIIGNSINAKNIAD
jgi:hypothetical protein